MPFFTHRYLHYRLAILLVTLLVFSTSLVAANGTGETNRFPMSNTMNQDLQWVRTINQPIGKQDIYRLGEAAVSILVSKGDLPLAQPMVEHEVKLLKGLLGKTATVKEVKQLPADPISGQPYYAVIFATRANQKSQTHQLEISALISINHNQWARLRYSSINVADPRSAFAYGIQAFSQILKLQKN